MASSVVKQWRESASLIIASRRLMAMPLPPQKTKPKRGVFGSLFRQQKDTAKVSETPDTSRHSRSKDSSTTREDEVLRLMLMRRGGDLPNSNVSDFQSGSSAGAGSFVFPGGKLHEADFSKDWLNVFCSSTREELVNLFTHGKVGAPIFHRDRGLSFSQVPSELALRLTAIRETFEESGVLLARAKSSLHSFNGLLTSDHSHQGCVAHIPNKLCIEWRERIMKDASEFIKFCQELEVVPDVWSLYEWSNWLTPSVIDQRFDAVFFISCIDEAPQEVDQNEISGMWTNPSAIMNAYAHNMITLSPPLIYEISRLIRFRNVDDLLTLASKRSSYRSQRWMPIVISCKDGLLFVLPGDDLYPNDLDENGHEGTRADSDSTIAELNQQFPTQHRMSLHHGDRQFELRCNLQYVDGHILPAPYEKLSSVKVKW